MRIAVAQMTSGIDPAENAAAIESAVAEAALSGAVMLFTPEMSGLLDRDRKRAGERIEMEARDTVLTAARAASARHGMWISLGSLAVRHESSEKWANRSILIDDSGGIVARYDKMHLFDVDLPTGESWRESSAYGGGDALTVNRTPAGVLGLSICYDVRFPALYQALSAAGAEVLSIPAAFTVPTGEAHWHLLLRARAVENACWVVAAAQCGHHQDGRRTYGHSLVVDPWGEVVLDMGAGLGVGFAEIDLSAVATARERIPVLAHRRPIPHIDRQP